MEELGLNLDQLETFARVVECGSFTSAASKIGVTQPAVSLQVRRLERQLGVLLLERSSRGAQPTLAGSELMEHYRSIQAAVADARRAMQHHRGEEVGRLRIATGATACIYFMPPILRQLRSRFPGLEMRVHTGNTEELLVAIEENRIDVGLLTMPATGRALRTKTVLREELAAVTSAAGPALPERVTPEDLRSHPFIGHSPSASTTKLLHAWCLTKSVSLKPVMELESVEAIKELIVAGLGCAVLPRMALGDRGHVGRQVESQLQVRPLRPRLERRLAIVQRSDRGLDWALREFLCALEEHSRSCRGSGRQQSG